MKEEETNFTGNQRAFYGTPSDYDLVFNVRKLYNGYSIKVNRSMKQDQEKKILVARDGEDFLRVMRDLLAVNGETFNG